MRERGERERERVGVLRPVNRYGYIRVKDRQTDREREREREEEEEGAKTLVVTTPPPVTPSAHLRCAVFIGTILSAYSIIRDGE